MVPEDSLPCSQEPTTGPYPQARCIDTTSVRYILILSPIHV